MTDDRLRIDLERVLRSRLGDRRMRWIPRRLIAWLERLICQREMNEVLDHAGQPDIIPRIHLFRFPIVSTFTFIHVLYYIPEKTRQNKYIQ